jgi:hypothetical protein
MNVLVKDRDTMAMTDIEDFETVLVVDLPPSVDEYVEVLTGAARHAVVGRRTVSFVTLMLLMRNLWLNLLQTAARRCLVFSKN